MIILYIAAVVFVIVEGALVYSVYKFRAKKVRTAAQIHGNTRLEIAWTIGAAMILVVLTVVTFIKLPSILNPPNSSAAVPRVVAEPADPPNGKKLDDLRPGPAVHLALRVRRRPARTTRSRRICPTPSRRWSSRPAPTVVLNITAIDVIHSWWVPSLGGKVDAVPGYTTYTWFKAPGAGALYHGQCAQLCGRQHAFMTAQVRGRVPQRVPGVADAPEAAHPDRQLAGDPAALVPHSEPETSRRLRMSVITTEPAVARRPVPQVLTERGRRRRARASAGSSGS